MFSSSAGPGGVRWLQPVQRRRRRRRRRVPVGPIVAVVALLALAAGGYAYVRKQDEADDPSREVAQRFADAWAGGDLDTMWRLTTARTHQQQPFSGFKQSYRQSTRAVTAMRVRIGNAGEPKDGRVPVPVVVRTRVFGTLRGTIAFPVERTGETARVAWSPELRLPGLRRDERVQRRVLRQPSRASVFDADGRRLSRTDSAPRSSTGWSGSTTGGSVDGPAPSCATASASSPRSTWSAADRSGRRSARRSSPPRRRRWATASGASR